MNLLSQEYLEQLRQEQQILDGAWELLCNQESNASSQTADSSLPGKTDYHSLYVIQPAMGLARAQRPILAAKIKYLENYLNG